MDKKDQIVTKTLNRSQWQNDLLLVLSSARQYVRQLDDALKRYDPRAYQEAKYNLERELTWLVRKLEAGPEDES
jgi:hypothetical protein